MKDQVIMSVAVVAAFSIGVSAVSGQTKTLTPSLSATQVAPSKVATSSGTLDKEVQDLKDKVANKVAELRQKDRKAVSGIISGVKGTTISIKSSDDVEYEIKIDDTLTKYYQVTSSKKEIKLTDLKKDDYIIVTGPILDKSVTANTIYRDEQYIIKSGKITEVNKDDYYVKVITPTKDNYTLDIENRTIQYLMDIKTLDQNKVGFSKFKEGDVVHFIAKRTGKETEANRYSAEKIIIIPQEYFIK
jgi:hypothetical protein